MIPEVGKIYYTLTPHLFMYEGSWCTVAGEVPILDMFMYLESVDNHKSFDCMLKLLWIKEQTCVYIPQGMFCGFFCES